MIVYQIATEKITGEFQKVKAGVLPKKDSVLFIRADDEDSMKNLEKSGENAAAIIVEENPQIRAGWDRFAARPVSFTTLGNAEKKSAALIFVSKAASGFVCKIRRRHEDRDQRQVR